MAMEINHWLLSSILPMAVLGQNHYQTISVPCAGDAGRWGRDEGRWRAPSNSAAGLLRMVRRRIQ